MKIMFTWVSLDTEAQSIADLIGHLARNWSANVIKWANSNTAANVHNVESIEARWVCGKLSIKEQKIYLCFAQSVFMSAG